jgi:RNA 3'-terminal phosphate cyclase (ATP)
MMIEIDGSQGEGGGQVVRSSLALSAMTGKPLLLSNIRGGRKKPGLLRQHLTGLRAIAAICDAEVCGGELGSAKLSFVPSSIRGANYTFQVGSAGSAILVAQTVLPALMLADVPSTITIGGGTHAAWAPPFDFFARCFLPQLTRMNANVTVSLRSHGFYPAGGGEIEVNVIPNVPLSGLELVNRMGELRPKVTALVSRIPVSVGERECDVIRRKTEWREDVCRVIHVTDSAGPGNVVMIECEFDNVIELFIGFGKVGVKAEQIARSTLREAQQYLSSNVPVGEYLADQLLLPMGIAATQGQASLFRTMPLSPHSETQIELIKRFLDIKIESQENSDGSTSVRVD